MKFTPLFFCFISIVVLFISTGFISSNKKVILIKKRFASFREKEYSRAVPKGNNTFYIVIDKSDYQLKIYDSIGWYASFPVVFGISGLGDKMQSGDKKTPEGHFNITQKKVHSKWSYVLMLDYPNGENLQLFEERKTKGLLPKNASIGNGIAIHATRPEEEWTVDNFYNWTDGCVAVKYSEMKDLYNFIKEGTQVKIQQ
jgi:murein L,D-transpeptidase YafK